VGGRGAEKSTPKKGKENEGKRSKASDDIKEFVPRSEKGDLRGKNSREGFCAKPYGET